MHGTCLVAHPDGFWSNTRVGVLTDNQRGTIWVLARRVVPESAAMTLDDRGAMLDLVDQALAARSPAMRRQFGLFLQVLRWSPVLRYLRPMERLGPHQQDAVLRAFQEAPVQLVRSGFWGVRTLIFIGYYGRPEVGPSIAYRPSRDGNAVLHARTRR